MNKDFTDWREHHREEGQNRGNILDQESRMRSSSPGNTRTALEQQLSRSHPNSPSDQAIRDMETNSEMHLDEDEYAYPLADPNFIGDSEQYRLPPPESPVLSANETRQGYLFPDGSRARNTQDTLITSYSPASGPRNIGETRREEEVGMPGDRYNAGPSSAQFQYFSERLQRERAEIELTSARIDADEETFERDRQQWLGFERSAIAERRMTRSMRDRSGLTDDSSNFLPLISPRAGILIPRTPMGHPTQTPPLEQNPPHAATMPGFRECVLTDDPNRGVLTPVPVNRAPRARRRAPASNNADIDSDSDTTVLSPNRSRRYIPHEPRSNNNDVDVQRERHRQARDNMFTRIMYRHDSADQRVEERRRQVNLLRAARARQESRNPPRPQQSTGAFATWLAAIQREGGDITYASAGGQTESQNPTNNTSSRDDPIQAILDEVPDIAQQEAEIISRFIAIEFPTRSWIETVIRLQDDPATSINLSEGTMRRYRELNEMNNRQPRSTDELSQLPDEQNTQQDRLVHEHNGPTFNDTGFNARNSPVSQTIHRPHHEDLSPLLAPNTHMAMSVSEPRRVRERIERNTSDWLMALDGPYSVPQTTGDPVPIDYPVQGPNPRLPPSRVAYITRIQALVSLRAGERPYLTNQAPPFLSDDNPLSTRLSLRIMEERKIDSSLEYIPFIPSSRDNNPDPGLRPDEEAAQIEPCFCGDPYMWVGTAPSKAPHEPCKMPNCRHVYGRPCAMRWLLDRGTCPSCRRRSVDNRYAITEEDASIRTLRERAEVRMLAATGGAQPVERSFRTAERNLEGGDLTVTTELPEDILGLRDLPHDDSVYRLRAGGAIEHVGQSSPLDVRRNRIRNERQPFEGVYLPMPPLPNLSTRSTASAGQRASRPLSNADEEQRTVAIEMIAGVTPWPTQLPETPLSQQLASMRAYRENVRRMLEPTSAIPRPELRRPVRRVLMRRLTQANREISRIHVLIVTDERAAGSSVPDQDDILARVTGRHLRRERGEEAPLAGYPPEILRAQLENEERHLTTVNEMINEFLVEHRAVSNLHENSRLRRLQEFRDRTEASIAAYREALLPQPGGVGFGL